MAGVRRITWAAADSLSPVPLDGAPAQSDVEYVAQISTPLGQTISPLALVVTIQDGVGAPAGDYDLMLEVSVEYPNDRDDPSGSAVQGFLTNADGSIRQWAFTHKSGPSEGRIVDLPLPPGVLQLFIRAWAAGAGQPGSRIYAGLLVPMSRISL